MDSLEADIKRLSDYKHKLRTFSHQILGYTELVLEEAESAQEQQFLTDLQKVHSGGKKLLSQIGEYLDQERLESGKFDLEMFRIDLSGILDLIVGYVDFILEDSKEEVIANYENDLKKIKGVIVSMMESLKEDTDTFSHFGAQVADRDAGLRTEFFVKKDDSAAPKTASTVTNSQSKEANQTFSILIVDDDEMNRDVLERRLNRQGYRVQMAENGRLAVDLVQKEKFDLILLDLMMPVLDGFGALTEFKNNAVTRHIPVIMLSARDEIDNVVRCIEIGAEDYLPKPFNPLLLNARIEASLEKKRLRDQEQAFVKKLYVEREKSKRLLLNILPASIADRLKDGQTNIAESFEKASVLFARIHGITELSKERSPQEIVTLINDLISGFDWLAEFYRFEKANTLGDTYMAVSGVPTPRDDYVQVNAEMALEMMRITKRFNSRNSLDVQLRIGISSGPVMAGIIGKKFITYYFWGETVDIANKMETHGKSGSIQVSSSTQQLLTDKYDFTENEEFDFSQDQTLETFFLTGRK